MLTFSNSKLGKTIGVFNLPAGITCPGMTVACSSCYAAKVEKIYPNAKVAYARNLDAVMGGSDWTDSVMAQIKKKNVKTVRIHANGDFFSSEYILDWHLIASDCPQTVFFAFTRSWSVPGLLPALDALKALPNVRILASVDYTSDGTSPKGWRIARMLTKDTTKTVKRTLKVSSGIVCPEQAKKVKTCGDCKICFSSSSFDVNFLLH